MKFSRHFGVKRKPTDDWFDPIIDRDTHLFVDPFLLFQDDDPTWSAAHKKVVDHFNRCFELIAQGNLNPASIAHGKAVHLLAFKEPRELCLGYTRAGTSGAGSGLGFARLTAAAITNAIRRGVKSIRHFEELAIFEAGIGADRISDMTCAIIKPELIAYTKAIAARYEIPTERLQVSRVRVDPRRLRWVDEPVRLPRNPYTGGPILLVPRRLLRRLPTLNADEWFDAYQNEQLRTDMSYEVLTNVDKATICDIARHHPDAVHRWVRAREETRSQPYDFERDPRGVYVWEEATYAYVLANPLAIAAPSDARVFEDVIEMVVDRCRDFVEHKGGWKLLWDGTREKPEEAAQLILYGVGTSYCEANNVVLDPESDFGRGPVDFKFSSGYKHRAHLEMKKLENIRFWHGLEKQLPTYLQSDSVKDGWFVAVRLRDGAVSNERVKELPARARAASATHKRNIRTALIDGRPKPPASKAH